MNNLRIFIYLFIFNFQFSILNLFAQFDPPLRIELESAKDQQDYKFVPLSNHGVAVFYQSAILSLDTAQWVFIHYDTNLVRTGIYKLKIPNLCQYIAADFSNDKLYLFLQKPAYKKDTLKNYLLEWNLKTKDFQLSELLNYRDPYLTSIKVADDYLFMIINEQKTKSIIYYNYKTDIKHAIQFAEDEIISIESLGVDVESKKTYFNMFLKNKKGTRSELFVTDYSGKIKERTIFPFYQDLIYNSAKISLVGKDSLLICGGYSQVKDKKSNGSYTGIYTLLFVKNQFSEIHTYPFGSLLEKESGLNTKHFSDVNLTMNAHIAQIEEQVFVITELFYPEYQYTTSSHRYYDYNPNSQVFSGFRFFNAYILEFDKQSLLVNEWFVPIKDVLTQSFYNLVNLYSDKNGNTLFYYINKNEIISQFMNGKKVLAAQNAIPIELLNKTDFVEYSSNISMRRWYNNNFLLSGYQYIRNTQRGGKGKRYVFFLNKLICE